MGKSDAETERERHGKAIEELTICSCKERWYFIDNEMQYEHQTEKTFEINVSRNKTVLLFNR